MARWWIWWLSKRSWTWFGKLLNKIKFDILIHYLYHTESEAEIYFIYCFWNILKNSKNIVLIVLCIDYSIVLNLQKNKLGQIVFDNFYVDKRTWLTNVENF